MIQARTGMRMVVMALLGLVTVAASAAEARDWREEADRRIEQHRKGDFTLKVLGPDGRPLTGESIDVRQTRSAFHFGTAVNGEPWDEDDPNERKYAEFIRTHFNTVVCENDMKWYATEKRRDVYTYERADRMLRWADENDLAMRGHCLLWSKAKWVQPWVRELSDEEIRREVDEHLERIVPRYRGALIAWDVNNEMLDGHFFRDHLGPGGRAHIFRKAHALDPNTPLHVNEYGILDSDAKMQRYIELIRSLQADGAPIHGIGIQEHAAQRFDTSVADELDYDEARGHGGLEPFAVWRRLDELAKLGMPIHFTEVTSYTSDPQRRADTLEALFRVGYAHPQVDAILLWGFWGRRHFKGADAALVDAEWNLTPAGERIRKLLLDEWRTQVQAQTDDSGTARFRGFHGTYEVLARDAHNRPLRGTVELTRDGRSATVRLSPQR